LAVCAIKRFMGKITANIAFIFFTVFAIASSQLFYCISNYSWVGAYLSCSAFKKTYLSYSSKSN
jgi:hypothetical protein